MTILKYALLLLLVGVTHLTILSQNHTDDKWMRVQTENGEFSVEVPKGHFYFFDKTGFFAGSGFSTHAVRDVRLLTAMLDGTVIKLEIYRTSAEGFDGLIETATGLGAQVRSSRLNEIPVKEIVTSVDRYRFTSYFFRSNEFVYVLSSTSRGPDTEVSKRFINSVRFIPDLKAATPDGGTLIRHLPLSPFEVKVSEAKTNAPNPPLADPTVPAPNSKSMILISRARAAYTNAARSRMVQGEVRLRVDFASNGSIPRIEIVKDLPEGLTRQALFAALRLQFLPAEKDGKPISVRKTVEYKFAIY